MSTRPASRQMPLAPDSFPKGVLWAAAAMVAISLISVGWVRLTGNGPDQLRAAGRDPLTGERVAERALRFEDRPDGAIAVIDASSGQQLVEIRGEQGFVRGSLRALTRERKQREMGSEAPFELIAQADGRLTLHDPATGKRVELESFGPTNAANFSRLLALPARSTP